MKPSFIIIGCIKCGTSSLYRYLNDHPQILPCKTKEPGYFNERSLLKLIWKYTRYKNLFPKINQAEAVGEWLDLGKDNKMHASQFTKEIIENKKYITGEATASTFSSANPQWVKLILPNVKLILLLREPSERFISHYNMLHRFHKEGRQGYNLGDLDFFVEQEISAYKTGKATRILSEGMYLDKIPKWKKVFGDNMKLYNTSSFCKPSANDTMNEICVFLGIQPYNFNAILKVHYNSTGTQVERSKAYDKLREFYALQAAKLSELYGINFE